MLETYFVLKEVGARPVEDVLGWAVAEWSSAKNSPFEAPPLTWGYRHGEKPTELPGTQLLVRAGFPTALLMAHDENPIFG